MPTDGYATISDIGFAENLLWPSEWGESGTLKIVSDIPFVAKDGKPFPSGNRTDRMADRWCVLADIEVTDSVPVIDNFTLPQTDNSITPIGSADEPRYSGFYYDTNDTYRGTLFSDCPLSATLGSALNFQAWMNDVAQQRVPPSDTSPTTSQMNLAIQAIAYAPASTTQKGIARSNITPLDTAEPTFIDIASRGKTVYVRDYATGGDGTLASPWTGWDTAITWSQYNTYIFVDGYYSYSTSPQFGHTGIRLIGGGNVHFVFTGSGVGFDFTARDTPSGYGFTFTQACEISGIRLEGNSNMTVGFDIAGVQQGVFRNLRVKNVSQTAYRIRFSISSLFDSVRFSKNEEGAGAGSTVPVNGFLLDDWRSAAEPTQDNTFINPIAEYTSGYGIKVTGHSRLNGFYGGTSEANGGGIYFDADTKQNFAIGIDLEANSGPDAYITGTLNELNGALSASNSGVVVPSGAVLAHIQGGVFQVIAVQSGAYLTDIKGPLAYNVNGLGGGITDAGTDTKFVGFLYDFATLQGAYQSGSTNWVAPTLLNSWTNNGGAVQVAGYMRDVDGFVTIRGVVGGGAEGSAIFQLPSGFRPTKFEAFRVVTNDAAKQGVITIDASGNVSCNSGGTTSFYMNARFRVS